MQSQEIPENARIPIFKNDWSEQKFWKFKLLKQKTKNYSQLFGSEIKKLKKHWTSNLSKKSWRSYLDWLN